MGQQCQALLQRTTVIFFPAEKAGDKKLETTKIEAAVIAKGKCLTFIILIPPVNY